MWPPIKWNQMNFPKQHLLFFILFPSVIKREVKKINERKRELSAFSYLIELKNKTGHDGRVSKIQKVKYDRLEIQQNMSENKIIKISKFIVKARACTLDI